MNFHEIIPLLLHKKNYMVFLLLFLYNFKDLPPLHSLFLIFFEIYLRDCKRATI